MKILIAPDKFKGSLAAAGVCNAIGSAIKDKKPDAEIISIPLADGGEGTFENLMNYFRGKSKKVTVLDPLFRPITAAYGISEDGSTAFIEMARASGLQLLKFNERNPMNTSSYGTGELIADALNQHVKTIILGIGGSATNDAGIGMANALGYQFLNSKGEIITPVGKNLSEITQIESDLIHPKIAHTRFIVLCDVTNPLFGEQGAAFVYGPQKGASPEEIKQLDSGLTHFAHVVQNQFHTGINFAGAGAAGGIGGGSKFFLHAHLKNGIDYISELTGLEEKIKSCDHVITGEGKLDSQTLSGKVVSHVIKLAQKHQKPFTIVCGQCTLTQSQLAEHGINQVIILAKNSSEAREAISSPINKIKDAIQSEFKFPPR